MGALETGVVLLIIVGVGFAIALKHSDSISRFRWQQKCKRCGLEKGVLKCPGCGV